MLISSSLLPRLLAHPPSPLRYRCKPRTISFRSPVSRLHHYTTWFNWELPLENCFVYLSWLVNISKEFTFDKFFIYLFKTCVLQLENMHCIFNEKPHRPRSLQGFICIISQILYSINWMFTIFIFDSVTVQTSHTKRDFGDVRKGPSIVQEGCRVQPSVFGRYGFFEVQSFSEGANELC